MNKIWETIKLLVVIGFCVYALTLIGGCAGPQLTPEQVTQINVICKDDATCVIEKTDATMTAMLAQLEYEREDRRNIEVDKLCSLMRRCDAWGAIMFNKRRMGRIGKGAHIDRYGECKVTKRDRLRDYQCVSKDAVQDWMRQQDLAR